LSSPSVDRTTNTRRTQHTTHARTHTTHTTHRMPSSWCLCCCLANGAASAWSRSNREKWYLELILSILLFIYSIIIVCLY
jgi:hypothetical protein